MQLNYKTAETLQTPKKRNMRNGVRSGRDGSGVAQSGKLSAACKRGEPSKCFMVSCSNPKHLK
jgi:hypothetical protein